MKYLIDTNIFDKLLSLKHGNIVLYQEFQSKVQNNFISLCTICYQTDEIKGIKNENRKNALLSLIKESSIKTTYDIGIYDFYYDAIYR